jgi:hypothetical protein
MAKEIKIGDLVHLKYFGINGMVVEKKDSNYRINLFGSKKLLTVRGRDALAHLKGDK